MCPTCAFLYGCVHLHRNTCLFAFDLFDKLSVDLTSSIISTFRLHTAAFPKAISTECVKRPILKHRYLETSVKQYEQRRTGVSVSICKRERALLHKTKHVVCNMRPAEFQTNYAQCKARFATCRMQTSNSCLA